MLSDFGCGESSSRERWERPIAFALTSLQGRSARAGLLCHWSERASLRGAGGHPLVLCVSVCDCGLCPAAVLAGAALIHVRTDACKRHRPPFQAMWHDWPTAAPLCPRVSSPHVSTVSQNPLSGDLIKLEVFGVSKSASPLGRPNEKRCAPAASRRARRLQGLAHEAGKRACRMHR